MGRPLSKNQKAVRIRSLLAKRSPKSVAKLMRMTVCQVQGLAKASVRRGRPRSLSVKHKVVACVRQLRKSDSSVRRIGRARIAASANLPERAVRKVLEEEKIPGRVIRKGKPSKNEAWSQEGYASQRRLQQW